MCEDPPASSQLPSVDHQPRWQSKTDVQDQSALKVTDGEGALMKFRLNEKKSKIC